MGSETAFELDAEAAGLSGDEYVHFANFPGVWRPGQPVAASELGFADTEEAEARVAELGLPLLVVDVEKGSAPMPPRPNHLLSEDGLETLDAGLDDAPKRLTHAQIDALAADAGVSFPADVKTVDAKTAFLDAARAAQENPATDLGEPVAGGES